MKRKHKKYLVEFWKIKDYNEIARQIKSAMQRQSVSPLCPLHTEHQPPYTTEFTAHCRNHYTSFFRFCTEGRKMVHSLIARAPVYGMTFFRTGAFCFLAGNGCRASQRVNSSAGTRRHVPRRQN
ncbi:hypothetical protein A7X67_00895 [Clostridium sp. W14A]|nr:hypothetical protein A7X67_00895 [Clostridium sp. W14A]